MHMVVWYYTFHGILLASTSTTLDNFIVQILTKRYYILYHEMSFPWYTYYAEMVHGYVLVT